MHCVIAHAAWLMWINPKTSERAPVNICKLHVYILVKIVFLLRTLYCGSIALRKIIFYINQAQYFRGVYFFSGFTLVIGALDCTHVRIIAPSLPHQEQQYICRKGYHSINVQVRLMPCNSINSIKHVDADTLHTFHRCQLWCWQHINLLKSMVM